MGRTVTAVTVTETGNRPLDHEYQYVTFRHLRKKT
jgi:hypothetical protein